LLLPESDEELLEEFEFESDDEFEDELLDEFEDELLDEFELEFDEELLFEFELPPSSSPPRLPPRFFTFTSASCSVSSPRPGICSRPLLCAGVAAAAGSVVRAVAAAIAAPSMIFIDFIVISMGCGVGPVPQERACRRSVPGITDLAHP
jgi:hypothetical protein